MAHIFGWNIRSAAPQTERQLAAGIGIMLVLLVPTILAGQLDPRLLYGASLWAKPLKFEVSVLVHLATLICLQALLQKASQWVRGAIAAATMAGVAEVLYIVLQAARGRASHFNHETQTENIMYSLMGIGALALVYGSFMLGWALRTEARAQVKPGLRLGAILGLTLGSAATLMVASLLSSGIIDGPGHWIGGAHTDAAGLPLAGWSTQGGDLRVPHFVATHAMQFLPAAGWAADRLMPGRARTVVMGATLLWAIVLVAVFAQALMGQPLLRL